MPPREFFPVVKGEGGVFCVSIQSNDTITGFAKLNKAIGISLTNSNLQCVKNADIKRGTVVNRLILKCQKPKKKFNNTKFNLQKRYSFVKDYSAR